MNGNQTIGDITESQLEKLLIALGKRSSKDEILKLHAKLDIATEKVINRLNNIDNHSQVFLHICYIFPSFLQTFF